MKTPIKITRRYRRTFFVDANCLQSEPPASLLYLPASGPISQSDVLELRLKGGKKSLAHPPGDFFFPSIGRMSPHIQKNVQLR
jgi:hypothetical protein